MFDLSSIGGFGNAALIATAGTYILGKCQGIIRNVCSFVYTRYVGVFECSTLQYNNVYQQVSVYCAMLVKSNSIVKTNSFRMLLDGMHRTPSKCDVVESGNFSQGITQTLGCGTFFVRHKTYGIIKIMISITTGTSYNQSNFGEESTITIHFLTKPKSISKFITDVYNTYQQQSISPAILPLDKDGQLLSDIFWRYYSNRGRMLDSVFIPSEQKARIISDVRGFFEQEKIYKKLNVPHRRGMLLYGKPGTGKTSIVKAIHQELGITVVTVNLNNMNDASISTFFSQGELKRHNIIILFEDIDGVKSLLKGNNAHRLEGNEGKSGETDHNSVTLSGFLNALDGVSSPEGVYFIFTSNAPDSLDDALIRKGRIDMHEEIGFLTKELQVEMIKYLTGTVVDSKLLPNETKASEIQAICLEHLLHGTELNISKLPEFE